jgi:hypothetical protein
VALDFLGKCILIKLSKMCTRGTLPQTEEKSPHAPSTPQSSTASLKKELDVGPYGAYNEAVLPPSDDMRKIVGDMLSMAGGVAAVLLQIAVRTTFLCPPLNPSYVIIESMNDHVRSEAARKSKY